MVHGHLVELLRLGEVLLEEVAEVVVRAGRVHARVAPKRDADAVPREEHVFHRGVLGERLQHVVLVLRHEVRELVRVGRYRRLGEVFEEGVEVERGLLLVRGLVLLADREVNLREGREPFEVVHVRSPVVKAHGFLPSALRAHA